MMSSRATTPEPPPIVGRALLVSNDSAVVGQLTTGMQQFAIATDVCPGIDQADSLIKTQKFEAIVVDLALGEQVIGLFERIRFSPSNQKSVTFALGEPSKRADSRVQPNFVMQKPLTDNLVGNTLKAALGLIIREYRKYFRCPVSVPVVIEIENSALIPCEMMNISEGGLAINTVANFKPGAPVKARFTLPGEKSAFDIAAVICWCDKKGRSGLHFGSVPPEQKQLLQGWLSRTIEQSLPEPTVRLFQKAQ